MTQHSGGGQAGHYLQSTEFGKTYLARNIVLGALLPWSPAWRWAASRVSPGLSVGCGHAAGDRCCSRHRPGDLLCRRGADHHAGAFFWKNAGFNSMRARPDWRKCRRWVCWPTPTESATHQDTQDEQRRNRRSRHPPDKPVRTTCPYCGSAAGSLCRDADGACEVHGDRDHPANFGRLCSKGAALGETLDLEGRLLYPQVDGVQTDWGHALDEVAGRFRRIIDEHGPDAVAFYVSASC